jgi:hypothetical protein
MPVTRRRACLRYPTPHPSPSGLAALASYRVAEESRPGGEPNASSMSGRSPEEAEPGWGIGLRLPTPRRRKGDLAIPGSGFTNAAEISAAGALLAGQTMTATPPAIPAARTVRTRIQAGGMGLLSTAQPMESRAAAPLWWPFSPPRTARLPIGADPSLPRFLRCAMPFRQEPRGDGEVKGTRF